MNCKNCETHLQGKYCSHCGQNANVDKLSVSNFINELSKSVLQIDRGFFYTLKSLFFRPGKAINEYLSGKRKKHFKPVAYVLTFSTIYFLITQATGQNTWMDDMISGFSTGALEKDGNSEIPSILIWFSKNFAYTTLLLLPVFSIASYLAFLGLGKNYLEHIVINSYTTGQQAIFYSLIALLNTFIDSEVLASLPILLAVSYVFVVYWQLFIEGNRLLILLRSIFTYLLYLIFSFGILIAILGITEIMG